jgi:hypothetical protein
MHCTQEVDRHAILRLRERTIKRLHVLYQQLNIPKTINLTNNTSPQVTTNGTGSPTLHNKKKILRNARGDDHEADCIRAWPSSHLLPFFEVASTLTEVL